MNDLQARAGMRAAFDSANIYGPMKEDPAASARDGRLYDLENDTGTGRIAEYPMFPGITLFFNDIHMTCCNQNQATARDVVEINYCASGRYECSFGANGCCYLGAGDAAICAVSRKKSDSCFPLGRYSGVTLLLDLVSVSPETEQLLGHFGLELDAIRRYVCAENRCCVLRKQPQLLRLFGAVGDARQQDQVGVMRLKVLELLLFFSRLDEMEGVTQTEYLNCHQVQYAKKAAALLTKDLARRVTIEELSAEVGISPTALKTSFRGVYGSSIYAYARAYRLQKAQELLRETDASIAQIAHAVGYENPNKFASAFKTETGVTPTAYRKGVRLDR